MTTTMGVFTISFFLIVLFLLIKFLELGIKKRIFISRFISKGDIYLFKIKESFRYLVHQNKQKTIFFFLFHLPERIEGFFRKLKGKAHDKYFQMSSRVRGKQNLNSRANVSPFIRNISRSDDENRGNII